MDLKTRWSEYCSQPVFLVLVIFLLGTFIFLPTLGYDFVWDDGLFIKDNPQIKSFSHWPRFLTSTLSLGGTTIFYRPLVMFSLWGNYFLFDGNPWGYHLTNILVHGINASLVAYLALLLLQNPLAALMAGALFALHPAHPEAVAFLSARADLLFTLFSLLTLIALIKKPGPNKNQPAKNRGPLIWAPLFFLLALLTKETAVVLLIPLFLGLYQRSPEEPKRLRATMVKIIPSLSVLIPYLVLRQWALSDFFKGKATASLVCSPFFSLELFFRYLCFLIFPPQRVSYFYNAPPPYPHPYALDLQFWTAAVLTFAFLAMIIYLGWRKRETVFFFSLLLLPWLPPLYYSLYNHVIMLERYLYLPTVGLALLAGWGWLQIPEQRKKWAGVIMAAVLVVFGAATLWRTPLWKENVIFFEALKKEYPASPYVRNALGETYMFQNRWLESYQELSLAVSLEPGQPRYHQSWGWLLLRLGWYQRAQAEFEQALKLLPHYALALEGLGSTYAAQGEYETALKYLELALAADPQRIATIREKENFIFSKQPNLKPKDLNK